MKVIAQGGKFICLKIKFWAKGCETAMLPNPAVELFIRIQESMQLFSIAVEYFKLISFKILKNVLELTKWNSWEFAILWFIFFSLWLWTVYQYLKVFLINDEYYVILRYS